MQTNSRISEFPLEKALSTAMSHLWLVAVCCSLLGINKGEQVFRQANQTQSLSVFQSVLSEVPVGWFWFCCAIQGSKCLWSIFVVPEKQCSCISLPLSFHSAHKLWMGRYKQGAMSLCCWLENCSLQMPFPMYSVGVAKGSCSSALVSGQPQPCLKVKQARDRSTPHLPG